MAVICELTMTDDERRVLTFLADETGDFGYYGFAGIVQETGFDRKRVRRACRSLARKGLAEFKAGLFNEDGDVAGSGYGATREGVEAIYGPR